MQLSSDKIEVKISDKPVDYNDALIFLENRVQQLISKKKNELLWILEHNPVYTKGISAKNIELIDDKIFPVIETSRGGKFTFHGPGQKVVYVVLDLNIRGKEIKRFVRKIESMIINILKDLNIKSHADTKNIGIWVKRNNAEEKIAAIGIKVKKWIVYHGFSLNIKVDKNSYRGIVPCGISDKGIANVADFIKPLSNIKINEIIKNNFFKVFGL